MVLNANKSVAVEVDITLSIWSYLQENAKKKEKSEYVATHS